MSLPLAYIADGCSWSLVLYFNDTGLYDLVADIDAFWGTLQVNDITKLPQLKEALESCRGVSQDDLDLKPFVEAAGMEGRSVEVSSNATSISVRFK